MAAFDVRTDVAHARVGTLSRRDALRIGAFGAAVSLLAAGNAAAQDVTPGITPSPSPLTDTPTPEPTATLTPASMPASASDDPDYVALISALTGGLAKQGWLALNSATYYQSIDALETAQLLSAEQAATFGAGWIGTLVARFGLPDAAQPNIFALQHLIKIAVFEDDAAAKTYKSSLIAGYQIPGYSDQSARIKADAKGVNLFQIDVTGLSMFNGIRRTGDVVLTVDTWSTNLPADYGETVAVWRILTALGNPVSGLQGDGTFAIPSAPESVTIDILRSNGIDVAKYGDSDKIRKAKRAAAGDATDAFTTSYKFTLRDDVYFANGSTFHHADVEAASAFFATQRNLPATKPKIPARLIDSTTLGDVVPSWDLERFGQLDDFFAISSVLDFGEGALGVNEVWGRSGVTVVSIALENTSQELPSRATVDDWLGNSRWAGELRVRGAAADRVRVFVGALDPSSRPGRYSALDIKKLERALDNLEKALGQ